MPPRKKATPSPNPKKSRYASEPRPTQTQVQPSTLGQSPRSISTQRPTTQAQLSESSWDRYGVTFAKINGTTTKVLTCMEFLTVIMPTPLLPRQQDRTPSPGPLLVDQILEVLKACLEPTWTKILYQMFTIELGLYSEGGNHLANAKKITMGSYDPTMVPPVPCPGEQQSTAGKLGSGRLEPVWGCWDHTLPYLLTTS